MRGELATLALPEACRLLHVHDDSPLHAQHVSSLCIECLVVFLLAGMAANKQFAHAYLLFCCCVQAECPVEPLATRVCAIWAVHDRHPAQQQTGDYSAALTEQERC
jgi:hypothetical protein